MAAEALVCQRTVTESKREVGEARNSQLQTQCWHNTRPWGSVGEERAPQNGWQGHRYYRVYTRGLGLGMRHVPRMGLNTPNPKGSGISGSAPRQLTNLLFSSCHWGKVEFQVSV